MKTTVTLNEEEILEALKEYLDNNSAVETQFATMELDVVSGNEFKINIIMED